MKLLIFFAFSVLSVIEVYANPLQDVESIFSPKITGGGDARPGQFPAMVALKNKNDKVLCGAALLDMNNVLTAAHCVVSLEDGSTYPASKLFVAGDDLTISTTIISPSRQKRSIKRVYVHPQYNNITIKNDLAILRLTTPFVQTTTFYPVARSTQSPTTGLQCSVAGWGAKFEGGNATKTLQKVSVSVLNFNTCQQNYGGTIPAGSFCAGDVNGGKDACQGDSGGSLYCNKILTGVVSFGNQCGSPLYPGIYVDVSKSANFINNVLSKP